jgi:heterodisulfide reductase subunit A-like polyferredoxin
MYIYEKKGRYIIDFQDIPSKRAEMPEISVQERQGNFKEVETGFPEEVARAEAKRCLSCRRCLGCALCWAECKPEAINFDIQDQDVELAVDKVVLTSGMQRKIAPIAGNVSNKHMNVVTDLQVERMLADTGPSKGLIIRPQDGEVPKKICFVQTVGSIDDKLRDATLIFGINEAILAQKKIDGADISFISPDLDAFKASPTGSDLDKVSGINFINGTVVEAAEAGENKDIEVKYKAGGSEKTGTFGLVVLLTQPQLPPSIEEAAKQLGIEVSYASFLGKAGDMVETDKASVVLAQNA